ncbi:MAG: NAD(P)-binding domain-containing protein [Anaerolinea sp.]|nr:NAD(P)-binding domain-containing protein [Anaerolinea sp.]
MKSNPRVCVIGAGPAGITTAKNLLQVGITPVVYERQDQIGGNWVFSPRLSHSSVYETTHIITSKTLSAYDGFPMPDDYPDYPSHKQVLAYFQNYARHFGVDQCVRFNTEVVKAEKQPDETWRITLKDGTVETFDYLFVANGHHSDPRYPTYPGTFTGQMLHSHDYKSAAPFRDQRVLVIGGGNSACDIAVETGRISAFTAISMRRGYFISPKIVLGYPSDVLASKFNWLPRSIYLRLLRFSLWLAIGSNKQYGLPEPKHGILEAHLVMNSELLYNLRHGRVHPRPDIKCFDGKRVEFVDGRVEEYDTVIAATGFRITFPFFDKALVDFEDKLQVPLFLRMFHLDHPTLFFMGLFQPLGCIWPIADLQAKLAANLIAGNYRLPADARAQTQREVELIARRHISTPRHSIEVEYHELYNALKRAIPANAPAWTAHTKVKA